MAHWPVLAQHGRALVGSAAQSTAERLLASKSALLAKVASAGEGPGGCMVG